MVEAWLKAIIELPLKAYAQTRSEERFVAAFGDLGDQISSDARAELHRGLTQHRDRVPRLNRAVQGFKDAHTTYTRSTNKPWWRLLFSDETPGSAMEGAYRKSVESALMVALLNHELGDHAEARKWLRRAEEDAETYRAQVYPDSTTINTGVSQVTLEDRDSVKQLEATKTEIAAAIRAVGKQLQ